MAIKDLKYGELKAYRNLMSALNKLYGITEEDFKSLIDVRTMQKDVNDLKEGVDFIQKSLNVSVSDIYEGITHYDPRKGKENDNLY